jgi:hypothetical protein
MDDFTFMSFDVPAAFLQAPLNTSNCPRPLIGKIPNYVPHADAGKLVLHLKAWYGTRNANGIYDKYSDETILKIPGCTVSPMDPRIYIFLNANNSFEKVIISVHVDDGGVISTWPAKLAEILQILTYKFGDLVINNPVTSYLSMRIQRFPSGAFTFSMDHTIEQILKSTNMENIAQINQPARLDAFRIDPNSPPFLNKNNVYGTVVGKLIYPTKVRPDIKVATTNVSRFTTAPTERNSNQVMEILQYLKGTPDLGCTYFTTGGPIILGGCDSAHAVHENGESHFATNFHVGSMDNAPFAFDSKMQKTCITTAAAGGEFVVCSEACKSIIVFRNFSSDIGFRPTGPTPLHTDCDPAIKMANAFYLTKNAKSMSAKGGFIRECVARSIVELIHVPGEGNPTDLLAKPTTGADFKSKRNILMNIKSNPNYSKYL